MTDQPKLKLHDDTCLITWPDFLIACSRRRKDMGALYLLSMIGVLYLSATTVYALVGILAIVIAIAALLVVSVGFALFFDAQMTREVVVYHPDSRGIVFQDHQQWWLPDVMTWPDEFKLDYKGKRVLWIDAIDSKNLIPFKPWTAPLPETEIVGDGKDKVSLQPVTGSQVTGVAAAMKAIGTIQKHREKSPGEALQQGLMVGAIVVGMIAMLAGINRIGEIMGFGA